MVLLLAGTLRKLAALGVRKEKHRWEQAFGAVLRIWTRPTDPEGWKINHQTNLVKCASSRSGSPVEHRLPGYEFWGPSGGRRPEGRGYGGWGWLLHYQERELLRSESD